ncbi:hypothetical protein M0R04_08025 [Candidatus Dojkabacteria bacterium]|jgi:hypothetical protein|nr:hypothetical protein [Candidatus Dojkabacteria bacterium]
MDIIDKSDKAILNTASGKKSIVSYLSSTPMPEDGVFYIHSLRETSNETAILSDIYNLSYAGNRIEF